MEVSRLIEGRGVTDARTQANRKRTSDVQRMYYMYEGRKLSYTSTIAIQYPDVRS